MGRTDPKTDPSIRIPPRNSISILWFNFLQIYISDKMIYWIKELNDSWPKFFTVLASRKRIHIIQYILGIEGMPSTEATGWRDISVEINIVLEIRGTIHPTYIEFDEKDDVFCSNLHTKLILIEYQVWN